MNNEARLNLAPLWDFVCTSERFPKCAVVIAAFYTVLTLVSYAQSGTKPEPLHSARPSYQAQPTVLPEILIPPLAEVKAKSRVAVLLPSELPQPIGKAKYAVVDRASKDEYAISLYYELGIGNAGFAASFAANDHPNYGPKDIGNVTEVKLSRGVIGYFSPVSCGGSCAPANLWWNDGHILYQIQLRLASTLPEHVQQREMMTAADSAILSGPR